MKTVVIYKSKSGYSEKYAKWISEAVKADLFRSDDFDPSRFAMYDTIVYGGGLYASGIHGFGLIKSHFKQISNKKIIVFAVSVSPAREDAVQSVIRANFSGEMQAKIHFFMLRGGFDYGKLTIVDKLLMQILKLKIKSHAKRTDDEKGMLNLYDKPVDFTDKKNITPITKEILSGREGDPI